MHSYVAHKAIICSAVQNCNIIFYKWTIFSPIIIESLYKIDKKVD